MKLIFRYLRPYLLLTLLAPALMMLEVCMDLLQPALMATIVDKGIATGNLSLVLASGSQMLLVAGIGLLGGIGCSLVATKASTSLGADLRTALFTRIQGLAFADLDKLETGNLITILTVDVSQLETISRMLLRIIVRAPLQVIGSLFMAIRLSPSLSLSVLLLIPLLMLILATILRKVYPLFSNVQGLLDRLNTRVRENLTAKRLVKAFTREACEEEKFSQENEDLIRSMTRASRMTALIHPSLQLILHLGMVFVLWAGGLLVRDNGFPVGKLMAFIQYLTQILWSLMMVGNLLMRLARARASAERVRTVLEREPTLSEEPDCLQLESVTRGLNFMDVDFCYAGRENKPALTGISLSLKKGETLGIIGATGSGKTTLVNLIPRFYDVSKGGIFIDDKDIRHYSLGSLRKHISIVMQDPQLFKGTIIQNILYGYEETDAETAYRNAGRAAEIAGIADFITTLPAGYHTDLNQRGLNLSGGQKQRIALARALAVKPSILILDDATSSVDTLTERRIHRALEEETSGLIRIIISQRLDSVLHADKILILERGRQAGLGTHRELLATNPLYKAIYASQYGTGVENELS